MQNDTPQATRPAFRPFDNSDFDAFAGVESDNPQIAFHENDTLVLDGNRLEWITADADAFSVELPTEAIATLVAATVLGLIDGDRLTHESIRSAYGLA